MIVIFVAALPVFLMMVYALPFVHPASTLMVRDVVMMRGYERQWLPLEEISPHLVNAVMMAEDGKFCSHSGVDWDALQLVVNHDGGPHRGASTITMQLVKNLFLWQDRSYIRKGVEIPLALISTVLLSKRRVMEIYLNIAEWGPGIYGAEAAARHYFKRSARNLTPRQAALLAITLPNPYMRNPVRPTTRLTRLARLVELRARNSGAYITCLQ